MSTGQSWPLETRRPSSRSPNALPHPHYAPGHEIFLSILGANEYLNATKQLLQRDPEVSFKWDKLETLVTTSQLLVAFAFVPTFFSLGLLIYLEPTILVVSYASLGLISAGLGYITDLLSVRIKRQSPLFQFEDSRVRKIHLIASTFCVLITTLSFVFAHYGWFDPKPKHTPERSIRRHRMVQSRPAVDSPAINLKKITSPLDRSTEEASNEILPASSSLSLTNHPE